MIEEMEGASVDGQDFHDRFQTLVKPGLGEGDGALLEADDARGLPVFHAQEARAAARFQELEYLRQGMADVLAFQRRSLAQGSRRARGTIFNGDGVGDDLEQMQSGEVFAQKGG